MKNIVLIGFMGTGKSSVASLLASRLGREFYDMDEQIELLEGKSIKEIFLQNGESYFRQKESEMVENLCEKDNMVIATGGGTVLNLNNVCYFQENSIIIRLNASSEAIVERITNQNKVRPLLNKGEDLLLEVKVLSQMREGFYIGAANYSVDTTNLSLEEVVDYIIKEFLKDE